MNKIISLVESIYILYMFNYFKTSYQINHPYEITFLGIHRFMKHPLDTNLYESKICPLGNITGYCLAIWFILRHYIKNNKVKTINNIILNLIFFISIILNLNAFIYFLPIFIIDKYTF